MPHKRNSFILFKNPEFSLYLKGETVIVDTFGGVTTESLQKQFGLNRNPLSVLENYLSEGYFAVGYFGYEFSRFTEEGFLPVCRKDGEALPDMYFLFFKETSTISGDIGELKYLIQPFLHDSSSEKGRVAPAGRPCSNMTKNNYITTVEQAKRYIESGDVYQVNLSQRFTIPFTTSPIRYFLDLYNVQPVPFGCYIDFREFQLISGSMELFLRKEGAKLVTKPIKGTKKRGFTQESDATLKAELINSEKERAENLMIVDLMRNDIGRVCKYGTIKVNKLFDIESYSTLHQMVSEVEGFLRDDVKLGDIIKNTFPPGSITGAPKKRAVEIIDELEPHLRGPYCGAIGILSPDGDFTLSVAIRVLFVQKNTATFWVGGGIVWDSEPEREYEETLIKARAIEKALGVTV